MNEAALGPRMARRSLSSLLIWLCSTACFGAALVQDADPAEGPDLQSAEGTVAVDSPAPDPSIADRLQSILNTTGRFADLDVRVEQGVVFLDGVASSPADLDWARQIALRTQDVVAVVNDLRVEEGSRWTLAPAWAELEGLGQKVIAALPLFVTGLILLAGFFFVGRWVGGLVGRSMEKKIDSSILRSVIEKFAFLAVLMVGVYVFLRVSGLTRVAVTVVGGTGVVGLVLGFAFRDIAENFLASLLISVQRPFRLGDTIEVAGHTGLVQKVSSRGTLLMDFDGNHIQIANANVYKSTIKNFVSNPRQRIQFAVGVGYDSSISEAQSIVHDMLSEHSAVLDDPAPQVLVDELGASTVNLVAYCWIDGSKHSRTRIRSSLMRLALNALSDAGISMPDESREIVFPEGIPIQEGTRHPSSPAPNGTVRRREKEREHSAVEGGFDSEVGELQAQTEGSRDPEEESGTILTA